jgi:hypothetical protein
MKPLYVQGLLHGDRLGSGRLTPTAVKRMRVSGLLNILLGLGSPLLELSASQGHLRLSLVESSQETGIPYGRKRCCELSTP